jgi:hypothetical protein
LKFFCWEDCPSRNTLLQWGNEAIHFFVDYSHNLHHETYSTNHREDSSRRTQVSITPHNSNYFVQFFIQHQHDIVYLKEEEIWFDELDHQSK